MKARTTATRRRAGRARHLAARWLALGVPLASGLLACSRPVEPVWIPLAERFTRTLNPSVPRPGADPDDEAVAVVVGTEGLGLELHVPPGRWDRLGDEDVWSAPIDLELLAEARARDMHVERDGTVLPWTELTELAGGTSGFNFGNGKLLVSGGDVPPGDVRLRLALDDGTRAEGRLDQPGITGEGVLLPAGSRAECRVDVPPGSALRFGTTARLLSGRKGDAVFRVRLDGELLWEASVPLEDAVHCRWYEAALPARGVKGARIELEVSGATGVTSFVAPRIGPAEVGTRAARPWSGARPDIVIVLADTFRADNLTAYGGTAGVTPNLDRLAARSLCFRRAWSTSTWTLPSHATLFTGYYPGRVMHQEGLPEGIETIVERLAAGGYRTGAVTGGGFVSPDFGLDQGFSYFAQCRDYEKALAEAQRYLEADDGRPTFLFLQTYRVHEPYSVSKRARTELGERLGIEGELSSLMRNVRKLARGAKGDAARGKVSLRDLERTPELLGLAQRLRGFYLGGVADFDRLFQGFLESVEKQGLLASGYLFFTSDHGEAFLDHDAIFHGAVPHEELARIPLLLCGRNVEPGVATDPVSLLDVAPTLAQIAGIPGAEDWRGCSLLGTRPARTLLGFQFFDGEENSFFVLDGSRKVILANQEAPEERVLGAYDLERDPGEQEDLAGKHPEWIRDALERSRDLLEATHVPKIGAEEGGIDPQKAAELRALGY